MENTPSAQEYGPMGSAEFISGGPAAVTEDAELAGERRCCVVTADQHGQRVDRVLVVAVPEFSRSYLQELLSQGCVRLNGRVLVKAAQRVKATDVLDIELRPTAQAQAFMPEPMALDVVHEDEHLLVINKPAGLVVHPAAGHWRGTLLNGLLAHHAGAARLARAGIVHRLDKDTSGLMVVGKTQAAVDELSRMIAARTVERLYLALAHGPWRHGAQIDVDQPMGRDSRNRLRMAVVRGDGAGKPAQTRFVPLDQGVRHVLLACKLHTGRTHQIRVHAAWLGNPLVADALYGGRAELGLERQALHAHRLRLPHPLTGQPLTWNCPPPADMQSALVQAGLQYNAATWWQAVAS